ncbi:SOS response-associated peptidase [Sphingomonas morindae]|uniref:Abasic site processing protein n=1 Tax=Sphingomonas morindae TaxID=1541170 RepID=A0ABY4XB55_9SPHN|nr:SOS response-associated peptidase family protein [Sphingomonas morindae]USI73971.1 SOS response-associated peptidase family protein [Sphingomonas morindae]
MCNRYRMGAKEAELLSRYGIISPYPVDESYPPDELFPKKRAFVVRAEQGARRLDAMRWGFPHMVTGASGKRIEKPVTNVRNYASPFWRSALQNPARRCLVPFTSFSEYGPGPVGQRPLHWFSVPSRPIVSFAGVWRPAEGGAVFAFLTTEPNSLVAPIHPKAMPVLLHDEDEARWLSAPLEEALTLAAPFPAQLMALA